MRKLAVIIVTVLLLAIICLQVLAALDIFPRNRLIKVCPVDAISMKGGKAFIDGKKCIGCQRCAKGIAVSNQISETSPILLPATTKGSSEPNPKTGQQIPTQVVKPDPSPAPKPKPEEKQVAKAAYKVDPDTCIGCGLCLIYCPENAITLVGGKAVIDPEKCINCGICAKGDGDKYKGCPVAAISEP